MARKISLHKLIDELNSVLEELSELDKAGEGTADDRDRARSTLEGARESIKALCMAEDNEPAYYLIQS